MTGELDSNSLQEQGFFSLFCGCASLLPNGHLGIIVDKVLLPGRESDSVHNLVLKARMLRVLCTLHHMLSFCGV
jgi:hypothetical protein